MDLCCDRCTGLWLLGHAAASSVRRSDGALFGLFVGTGIAGATALGHRMFSGHGVFVWLIESGNDIVNLGLAGAILAALR